MIKNVVREGRTIFDQYQGAEKQEIRRNAAIDLVGHLKDCFVKHWEYLESKQKEKVVDLWVSLGFDAPAGSKPSSEAKQKKLNLGINMIYYQLQYGGELIDIQSDPKKDDRVSGFAPDGWQRKMLDSVDRGNSALIIAPTSAGKTFVSYYCIEKVLRACDNAVVVYVTPSKALVNQVCGSIYAHFRNNSMKRIVSLGTLTQEYSQNAIQCQVLITVPECLQELILSRTPAAQKFVSRIKYVVFDEVHSIGASEESHIWEQLLLLIQCPFLALSATIGNANKLHEWLNSSEQAKSSGKRKVELINYGERYSELELSILNINDPHGEEDGVVHKKAGERAVIPLMPYGVYMPEKLRMFSIRKDQQLTARQILHLYNMMAEVDEATKKEFEPCKFFGQHGTKAVWISRSELRRMENALKERFMEWLSTDEQKINSILKILKEPVNTQLAHRSRPFNKEKVANDYIVTLVDDLKEKGELPAICFNESHVFNEYAAKMIYQDRKSKRIDYEKEAENKEKDDQDSFVIIYSRLKSLALKSKTAMNILKLMRWRVGMWSEVLPDEERLLIECLFLTGKIDILFSTSTLSLGVNMPCKTVIFGVDTLQLTPLLYHQMSGQAGRRGFDNFGNVIFMGVPTSKIRRLLTASLSNLQGNPPFTVIFLLRLFAYVHQQDILNEQGQKVTTMKQRAFAAKSLLEHSFSIHTRREATDGVLQKQLRMFSAFSFQMLRHLQLLSPSGEGKNFAEMAIHSESGASGTLLFIYLMQKKCFHQLLKKYDNPEKAQLVMLEILANLFTNVRMSPFHERNDNLEQVHVNLRGLPSVLAPYVEEYNKTISGLYKRFMAASSKDGNLFDPAFIVSGKLDTESVSLTEAYLVAPLFDQYSHDDSFLPVIDFNKRDHRGRKIKRSAYAYDFYVHGSPNDICKIHKIKLSKVKQLLIHFMCTLQKILHGLKGSLNANDCLVRNISSLCSNYQKKFEKEFK